MSLRFPPPYNLYSQNCSRFQRGQESMPFLPPGITIKSGAGASNGGSAASTEKEDPPVGKFAIVIHKLCAYAPLYSLFFPSSLYHQPDLPSPALKLCFVVYARIADSCACKSGALSPGEGRSRSWMGVPRRCAKCTRTFR